MSARLPGTGTRWGAIVALAALAAAAPAHAAGGADHPPTAAPFGAQATQLDSIRYALRVTDNNLMGVTITNYGFVGNNFVSRSPSFEYPLGAGFEHMVRGGLWVGARALDDQGVFTGVTTAAVDGAQGSSSQAATEFTPAGLDIGVRSSLTNSKYYNPNAVSEEDYIATYSDEPAKRASGSGENHRPLDILVRQENYSWSFSDYQHVLFFHYVIKNNGAPLQNAWVGFYSEMASGSKNDYSVWPPSASGSTVGGWYLKKWIQYDDSLRLFREHYCANQPLTSGCDLGHVPYWIGLKLLGVRPGNVADTSDKKITMAAWGYAPGSALRDEDVEKYAIMDAGTVTDLSASDLLPGSGDPVEMMAVGPFRQIDPGDSVEVDFALVGGEGLTDATNIQEHARFAQRAYDRDYVVPVPPPSPRLKVVARAQALDLYWDNEPEFAVDPTSPILHDFEGYRIYIGENRLALHEIAQFDKSTPPNDTTGFNTGLDVIRLNPPAVFDGQTYQYKYSIPDLRDGFKYYCAVTSYDLGNIEVESLESGVSQNKTMAIPSPAPGERPNSKIVVFPNPYRVEARWDQGKLVRDHYLWFSNLPERCTIKIFTLSGDLVFDTDFNGANYHGEGSRGIYDPQRELDVGPPTLSGASYGWDLISRHGQAVASGLYLYSVEDKDTGKRTIGKFLIVKSDRENFN